MAIMKMIVILAFSATTVLAEEPRRRIIISVPDRKLVLIENGRVVKTYEIAVGTAATPSPDGTFHIAERIQHPTWYGPKKIVAPGRDNPLGTRWMGLGYRGYGIHGTNSPGSIGKAASHGCFRMRNADAEDLFTRVQTGDAVEILRDLPPEVAKLFAPSDETVAVGGGE
jgi:lipoprotein-anchoring transpeptidase ErfK/SrfK